MVVERVRSRELEFPFLRDGVYARSHQIEFARFVVSRAGIALRRSSTLEIYLLKAFSREYPRAVLTL